MNEIGSGYSKCFNWKSEGSLRVKDPPPFNKLYKFSTYEFSGLLVLFFPLPFNAGEIFNES